MTDKEIIKALGVCISALDCTECPYTNVLKCSIERDCIDLINRQQAEIEKYRQTVGILAEKNGEVVGLLNGKKTKYIKKDVAEIFKNIAVNTARAEAIKEFAERLKEKARQYSLRGRFRFAVIIDVEDVNTLVKEMTEGQQC